MKDTSDDFVILGHISRAHGIHGAVVIHPYTDEPKLILDKGKLLELLSPDNLTRRRIASLKGKVAAQGVIAKFQDVTTRTKAQTLIGWKIGLDRQHLPPAEDDEIYLTDLIGMEVFTPTDQSLGLVAGILETGASPLLATVHPANPQQELLLPFHEHFIVSLDTTTRKIVLDLPPGLLD